MIRNERFGNVQFINVLHRTLRLQIAKNKRRHF